eukprot:symbB.v1.2.027622.t1/scaffold2810.1/size69760/4
MQSKSEFHAAKLREWLWEWSLDFKLRVNIYEDPSKLSYVRRNAPNPSTNQNGPLEALEDAPGADILTKKPKFDLEAIIKQRVWDEAFDDVVRKTQLPPSQRPQSEEDAVETLNFEKSRVGLGDIYAKQYEAEMLGHQTDAAKAEDKAKTELKELFARIMFKLDQLSNAHFTPRPPMVGAAADAAAKVPSLKMEETIPLMVSDASLQAPEEAKAPRRHEKDQEELSPDEKAAVRRTRKVARKKGLERKVEGGEMSLKDRREREEKLQEKNQKAKADKAQDLRGKKIFGGCFLFRRRWNAALVSGVGRQSETRCPMSILGCSMVKCLLFLSLVLLGHCEGNAFLAEPGMPSSDLKVHGQCQVDVAMAARCKALGAVVCDGVFVPLVLAVA